MGATTEAHLILRADATSQIGIGHMMRCLALAQAWQDEGGRATFLSRCESVDLHRRVETVGINLVSVDRPHPDPADLAQTLTLLGELQATWLVLDGYHFDPAYQASVRAAGYRLLVIDDCAHQPEYHADILLNQNINAEQLTYVCDADSQLLLGTRYVLLRREFLAWHGWHRDVPQLGRKLLVTLGGGDPDNATLNVIRALQGVGVLGLETKIVVGPANAHFSMLRKAVEEADERIQLLTAAPEMPALMAWADAAVAAAGSTSWELALMGVPSLLLVLSENQLPIAEGLARIGVAINLGWHQQVAPAHITQAVAGLLTSAEVRGEMARRGPALVDGSGVDRTLMRLRGIRTRLRRACEEDARLLWEWANDSEVRAVSFSPDPIPWDQHLEWFRARLRSPDCIFFIAVDEGEVPIGQVRFDLNGDEAVISIGLDAKCRGKGYGSAIIERASRRLYQISSARLIHAYVKPDNRASLKVFAKAGFRSTQTKLIRGQPAIDMILSRD